MYCVNATDKYKFKFAIQIPLACKLLLMQGSKLTPARLPEASKNHLGQVIFVLNLPNGQVNKIQRIKQLKQDNLETQCWPAFVAIN